MNSEIVKMQTEDARAILAETLDKRRETFLKKGRSDYPEVSEDWLAATAASVAGLELHPALNVLESAIWALEHKRR